MQVGVQVGVHVVILNKWLSIFCLKHDKLHWIDDILQEYLMMTSSV